MNNYERIEELVVIFFEGDECEKSDALEQIIEAFRPLIVKLCFRYFNRFDEDIYQEAVVWLIERTLDYDYKSYNKFAGYVKYYLDIFFKRQINKNKYVAYAEYDESLADNACFEDSYDFELQSILQYLPYKMYYIVKQHVINGKSLKEVAKSLDISYPYAKKLKKEALCKLKAELAW